MIFIVLYSYESVKMKRLRHFDTYENKVEKIDFRLIYVGSLKKLKLGYVYDQQLLHQEVVVPLSPTAT